MHVKHEAIITSGTHISGSWGILLTQLDVVLPERDGADFRAFVFVSIVRSYDGTLDLNRAYT